MRMQGSEVQALLSLQSLQQYLREATDVVGNTINMCDREYFLVWELRIVETLGTEGTESAAGPDHFHQEVRLVL